MPQNHLTPTRGPDWSVLWKVSSRSCQTRTPYPTTHERDTPPHNVITEVPVSVRTEKKFATPERTTGLAISFCKRATHCLEQRTCRKRWTSLTTRDQQTICCAGCAGYQGGRPTVFAISFVSSHFRALQNFAHSSPDGHVQGRIMQLGSHRPDNNVYMTFVPNLEQTNSKPEVAQRFVICFLRESKRAITDIFQHRNVL